MHDMKAIRDDANAIIEFNRNLLVDPDDAAHRLASFARDIADETPATAEWVEQVTPKIDGAYGDHDAFTMTAGGGLRVLPSMNDEDIYLAGPWPRGRVRLLALAMGLELREGK